MSDIVAESGTIVSLRGDKALVKLSKTEACEDCSVRIFCRTSSDDAKEMLVYNPIGARVGQQVDIAETGNLMLKLALMQFGVPLLGLLIGILAVFYGLGADDLPLSKELAMALGGLAGLLLGGTVTWIWSRTVAKSLVCVFEITAVKTNTPLPVEK
ncbi:MAG: SoxR reducing system RseC family protein [Proteobacteria bacterium]|nr:SoxR reducing system RseC family protein [Pseudomonadota bacterium]